MINSELVLICSILVIKLCVGKEGGKRYLVFNTHVAGGLSVFSGNTDDVLVDVEGELDGARQVGDCVHSNFPKTTMMMMMMMMIRYLRTGLILVAESVGLPHPLAWQIWISR